jgi:pimeloyl-ACP methyl ester carboxylesterase
MSLPPLILIPGLLNDAELWCDQIAALSDVADCRVADITQGDDLPALAQSVLADAPKRFALAGFSLGGYVAVEMARIAPERIERLALLDTSIRADTPDRAAVRRALDKAARAPGKFHGFGDRLLKTYLDPSHLTDDMVVDRIRGMTERLGPEVFVRQNNIERRDGAAIISSLTCPVVVICGENDVLTPLTDHEEMARLAAQARLIVIPGSGHMTPIENPHAVSAALRVWLTAMN